VYNVLLAHRHLQLAHTARVLAQNVALARLLLLIHLLQQARRKLVSNVPKIHLRTPMALLRALLVLLLVLLLVT